MVPNIVQIRIFTSFLSMLGFLINYQEVMVTKQQKPVNLLCKIMNSSRLVRMSSNWMVRLGEREGEKSFWNEIFFFFFSVTVVWRKQPIHIPSALYCNEKSCTLSTGTPVCLCCNSCKLQKAFRELKTGWGAVSLLTVFCRSLGLWVDLSSSSVVKLEE